jgi:signal transduction histidine kinase/ActR/RegA family two-component response regulator
MKNRKNDGTLFTEDASISPVFDESGRISEFVAVKRDITAELNLEAQLFQAQKMEAIGALAGGIAHDFNNLLFPLIGYAEMLQMDLSEDNSLQDYVLEILSASKRAKALVQQILAFSRQSSQEKTAVRVQGILNEVIRFSRASLPSTITVRTSIDKKCRPVLADPTQIHQVAMNLMTNAFHAMEEKGGELFISLGEVAATENMAQSSSFHSGIYAHISISDTGCGIDPSIQDKIFNPYFTTKEKGKGTGIGLAVVHGIIKSHGGHIELESEPGKGTRFDIFLPCINEDSKEISREKIIAVSGGDERILVVDDEEPVARMLRQMLERAGYSVTIRTSSTEALQLFRDNPDRFDIVITDMTMPNMTGDHLSIEMKKIRPSIPVIICTGFSEKINEDIAISMGIEGYVFKPVLQNEMIGMIRSILNKRD